MSKRAATDHRTGFSMWGQPDHVEQLGQSHNLDLLVHVGMVTSPDTRTTIGSITWKKYKQVRVVPGSIFCCPPLGRAHTPLSSISTWIF